MRCYIIWKITERKSTKPIKWEMHFVAGFYKFSRTGKNPSMLPMKLMSTQGCWFCHVLPWKILVLLSVLKRMCWGDSKDFLFFLVSGGNKLSLLFCLHVRFHLHISVRPKVSVLKASVDCAASGWPLPSWGRRHGVLVPRGEHAWARLHFDPSCN